MKKMIVLLSVIASQVALAEPLETVEIVRSKMEVPLTLELNQKTVRCLVGDYGASSLKISIPQLREYTAFKQTTRGETDPCINAGPCKSIIVPDGLEPSLVLDPTKPTEDVTVTVTLKEVLELDHEAKSCSRRLDETLEAHVRGLRFAHVDGVGLGDLDYQTCLKLKTAK